MGQQLTKQDIFEIVNKVANKTTSEIINIHNEVAGINNKVINIHNEVVEINNNINNRVTNINNEIVNINKTFQDFLEVINKSFSDVEKRMSEMETRLVTKSYLDEKISALRGDIMETVRKEDNKLGTLANKLADHKILPVKEIHEILAMEPFPKNL
ncbi:MAG: hypothetical protein V1664_00620 [Candidatus Uhrbacteria bacterium]